MWFHPVDQLQRAQSRVQVERLKSVGAGGPLAHLRVTNRGRPAREIGEELGDLPQVGRGPDRDQSGVADRQERCEQDLSSHRSAQAEIKSQGGAGRETDQSHKAAKFRQGIEGVLGRFHPVGPLRGGHGRPWPLVAGKHRSSDREPIVLESGDEGLKLVRPTAKAVQDQARGQFRDFGGRSCHCTVRSIAVEVNQPPGKRSIIRTPTTATRF